MFWFGKKIQYVDVLQEYRDIKIKWKFKVFDKILFINNRHTHNGKFNKWIIYNSQIDPLLWIEKYFVLSIHNGVVDNIIVDASYCTIKPDYWEFQEEFEALDAAKEKMKEIERLSKSLIETREEAEKLYQKWKRVIEDRALTQFWTNK